jgi:3-oxoacyl-[acyl-carrier protein] reductase
MSELLGRVALVTGASRGIGRTVAVARARAGCEIAVNSHARADAAIETVRLKGGGTGRHPNPRSGAP